MKINLNSVDEFFFKLDLFLTLFHVLIFFVKEIQNKSIECVFNKFWGFFFRDMYPDILECIIILALMRSMSTLQEDLLPMMEQLLKFLTEKLKQVSKVCSN